MLTEDKNKPFTFYESNILRIPKFGFRELYYYLVSHPDEKLFLESIEEWAIANEPNSFAKVDKDIAKIFSQLEEDFYTGTLTKKKIERISKQYSEDLQIYETYLSEKSQYESQATEDFTLGDNDSKPSKKSQLPKRIEAEKTLDSNIVIISGKAGSGKTSELYLLMKKCYEAKKQVRYLTYNRMLRHDAQLISSNIKRDNPRSNSIVVMTIHKLMYNMAENLGILTIISEQRVSELLAKLNKRAQSIKTLWHNHFPNDNFEGSYQSIPFNSLDIATNQLLRKFVNKYRIKNKKEYFYIKDFEYQFDNFIIKEGNMIEKMQEKNGFLRDYYNILKQIYNLYLMGDISEVDNDIIKFYQSIKPETWIRITKNRDPKKPYDQNSLDDIRKYVKRSLSQFSKYTIIVDEGQDFHQQERDILLKMSENKNIVVATGGEQQLIRHKKECRWDIIQTKQIAHIQIDKRNTSFRMKENIINLCNFIADKFHIELNLKPFNSKDKGSLIISNRKDNRKLRQLYEKFSTQGEKYGYSRYENIMFILDTNSKEYSEKSSSWDEYSFDEYDNIKNYKRKWNIFKLHTILGIDQEYIWLHEMSFPQKNIEEIDEDSEYDDDESNSPTSHQYRAIKYESCRGLEAWTVMCFDIDLFYDRKKDSDEAALFCSDDLFMTEDERRAKYAATQVLMALTRAIDTLYIEISNPNSELGKIIMEYIDIHKEFSIDNHVQDFHDEQENKDFYDDDIPF